MSQQVGADDFYEAGRKLAAHIADSSGKDISTVTLQALIRDLLPQHQQLQEALRSIVGRPGFLRLLPLAGSERGCAQKSAFIESLKKIYSAETVTASESLIRGMLMIAPREAKAIDLKAKMHNKDQSTGANTTVFSVVGLSLNGELYISSQISSLQIKRESKLSRKCLIAHWIFSPCFTICGLAYAAYTFSEPNENWLWKALSILWLLSSWAWWDDTLAKHYTLYIGLPEGNSAAISHKERKTIEAVRHDIVKGLESGCFPEYLTPPDKPSDG